MYIFEWMVIFGPKQQQQTKIRPTIDSAVLVKREVLQLRIEGKNFTETESWHCDPDFRPVPPNARHQLQQVCDIVTNLTVRRIRKFLDPMSVFTTNNFNFSRTEKITFKFCHHHLPQCKVYKNIKTQFSCSKIWTPLYISSKMVQECGFKNIKSLWHSIQTSRITDARLWIWHCISIWPKLTKKLIAWKC